MGILFLSFAFALILLALYKAGFLDRFPVEFNKDKK